MQGIDSKIACYEKHKNLKLAAAELDMSFQTLYWQLKKAGVSVSGDKERHGSNKDKFAARSEKIFQLLVPFAEDMNGKKFQAKVDFTVGDIGVEVKAAKRNSLGVGAGGDRWAFSVRRQIDTCDFFAMFAFDKCAELEAIFLIPAELIAGKCSISISCNGKSKWHPYRVTEDQLRGIFTELKEAA